MIKLHNNVLYLISLKIKRPKIFEINFLKAKALFVYSNTLGVFSYKTSYYMAIEYVFFIIICFVYL